MTRIAFAWALNSFALFFVMRLLPGIQIDRFGDLLAASLVIGLLNTFIRPVVLLFTLPVTIMTLGLFTLVVNGAMFYLAAALVKGFHVSGFGTAFLAAFLYSIFIFVLNAVFNLKKS